MRKLMLMLVLLAPALPAHCDGLDGPVAQAGRKALESGNVNHALPWVHADSEGEVKAAFARAAEARKLGARELAETYFLETLVRLHRAGEGAPYTGLKPAGRDLGPAIPVADAAVERGRVEAVVKLLLPAAEAGLRERFHRVHEAKAFTAGDVDAGRRFVAAYVDFVHYVERLSDIVLYKSAHAADHRGTH